MKIAIKNCFSRAGTLWGLWLLISFVIFQPSLLGQTITVTPNQGFTATITAATVNTTAPYQLTYLLVNSGGTVVQSNTTGSFTGVAAGNYTIYAINYDSTDPLAVIPAVGVSYAAPGGCSTELSRLVQVQDCLNVCTGATLTAPAITNATLTGTYRLDYVLVCGATITVNAATADGGTGSTSFMAPSTPQTCTLYAVNYDNAAGTPTYSGNLTVSGNTCHTVIDRCVNVTNVTFTLTPTNPVCSALSSGSILVSGLTANQTGYTVAYAGPTSGTLSSQTASSTGEINIPNLTGSAAAGNYTVTVTNSLGCSATATTTVAAPVCNCSHTYERCNGSAIGTVGVTATNTSSGYNVAFVLVCDDGIVTGPTNGAIGTIDATAGTANITYAQTVSTGQVCEVHAINYSGSMPTVAINTGTATVNDISISGSTCFAQITACITVNANPVVSASNNGPVCVGGLLTTTATITTPGTSPYDYNWSGSLTDATDLAATSHTVTVTGAAQTSDAIAYTVTVTDNNGCTANATTTPIVNTPPALTVQDISNTCPSATADLTTAITSSTAGLTVSYSSATPTAVGVGTYTVTVTNPTTGCSNTASVGVTINPCTCTPATICAGTAFGTQTVNNVNNTAGYSVALVLVCNNAVITVVDAADVVENATTGTSAGTISNTAPAPSATNCSIWAINYQGTGLAYPANITPTGSSNDITVTGFVCEEKIEKCYTINNCCPAATTVAADNGAVCSGGGTSDLAAWQTAVAAANTTGLVYSSVTPVAGTTAPDNILPTGVHSALPSCNAQTQTVMAYVYCDVDQSGTVNTGDTYTLVSTYTLTVYPPIQAPTIVTNSCSVSVTGICGTDLITLSGATGGGTITSNGTNSVIYTADPGDAAGTVNISIASSTSGNTCTYTGSTATPSCPPLTGSSIGNYVWNDLNNDGNQDEGVASGINGVTVNLYVDANSDGVPDGPAIATTITASDAFGNEGYYLFSGLSAGNYLVQFVLPNGTAFTPIQNGGNISSGVNTTDTDSNIADPTTGYSGTITLGTNEQILTVDAGIACPTITLPSAPQTVCTGTTVGLSVSTTATGIGAITYVYSAAPLADPYSGGTLIGLITPSGGTAPITNVGFPANTGTTPITYYVYAILSNTSGLALGCRPSQEMQVTVNPATPDVTLINNSPLCLAGTGSPTTLTLSSLIQAGPTTGTWAITANSTGAAANITGGVLTPGGSVGSITLTYTVTGTGPAGTSCATDVYTVTVPVSNCTSAPSCAANAGDIPQVQFCQGTYPNTTPSGWTPNPTFGGTYGPAPTPAGEYSFQYFITNDIPAPHNIQLAIAPNTLPVAADMNGLAPGIYRLYRVSWKSSGTGSGLLVDAGGGTVGTGDNVELIETDAAVDCIDLTYTYVTVRPNPVANAGLDLAVCAGSTINLSGSQTNAAANPVSYAWSGVSGFSSSVQNPAISNAQVTNSGNYTVTVTTAFGCTAADVVAVTVNSLPSVNAGADQTICAGTSVTIGTAGTTGDSYSWSPPTGLSATGIAQPTANPTMTTLYTVVVTNAAGCTASDAILVTVNPAPTPIAGSNTPLCSTRDILLNATGGTSYQWSGPNSFTSTSANPVILATDPAFPGVGSHTYFVTVTNNGCTATTSTVVTVNAVPIIVPTSNSPVCLGSTINLSANYGNATANDSYSWTGPAGFSSAVANPSIPVAAPIHAGVYTLTVANEWSCATAAQVTVSLAAPPSTTISKNVVCNGTTGTINLSVPSAGIGSTYQWSGPGALSSGTTQSIAGVSSGTYTYSVTITNAGGCSATGSTQVVVSCTVTCAANAGTVSAGSACPDTPISASVSGNNAGCTTNFILTTTTGTILYVGPAPIPGQATGSYLLYSYNYCTQPTPAPAVGGSISSYTTGTNATGCYDVSNSGTPLTINAATPALSGYSSVSQGSEGGLSPFAYNTETVTICGGILPYNFLWETNQYVRYDIQYTNVDCNNDGTTDGPGALITVIYADQANWAVTVTSSSNCTTSTPITFNNIPVGTNPNKILDIDSYNITGTPQLSFNGGITIDVSGGTCDSCLVAYNSCVAANGTNCMQAYNDCMAASDNDTMYNYLWSGPNGFTSSASDLPAPMLAYGWYSVTVWCDDGDGILEITEEQTSGWYWVPAQRRGRTKSDSDLASTMSVYPNPFSQTAMLGFYAATSGHATVKLYTVDGKEVQTLFDGTTEADKNYTLPINAGNLPSGVYVASLLMEDGEVIYEKVVITK